MKPVSVPSVARPSVLRQAWIDYAKRLPGITGQPFEYVMHATFKDHAEIPARHAEDVCGRRVRYFMHQVNRELYGKRWLRKGQSVFSLYAVEGAQKGFPHIHAIVGGAGLRAGMKRMEMLVMWDRLYGINRVWDYRGEAAVRYITKYVCKGGQVDLFAGPWLRSQPEP